MPFSRLAHLANRGTQNDLLKESISRDISCSQGAKFFLFSKVKGKTIAFKLRRHLAAAKVR